ncbi:MAG: hypothetical protein CXR31_00045 [Geobacter sp.]|nr:MAG: hypothetical protein CXR31_00045 [Geobacter sp.]
MWTLLLFIAAMLLMESIAIIYVHTIASMPSRFAEFSILLFLHLCILFPVLYMLYLRPLGKYSAEREEIVKSVKDTFILLQTAFSAMNEGILIVDFKTRNILEANVAAEKIFNYTRDDLVGSSTKMLHLNERMYEKFGEMILNSYRENGCLDAAFTLKRKDGTTFPSEHSIIPIMAEDGSYLRHVSVIRDVTERVKAHEKVRNVMNTLEEKNTFLESVITNMFSGIIVVDHDLRIKMANPYALRLCAKSAAQVVGSPLRNFCPEFEEHLAAGIGSGEITAHFCSNEYVVGFSLFNQTGAENKTVGHIINFKDLTEIMKIRKEMRQKERL